MQFVITSPWMFLTNRLRQPSDVLAEQDILHNWCQTKIHGCYSSEQSPEGLSDGLAYKAKLTAPSMLGHAGVETHTSTDHHD